MHCRLCSFILYCWTFELHTDRLADSDRLCVRNDRESVVLLMIVQHLKKSVKRRNAIAAETREREHLLGLWQENPSKRNFRMILNKAASFPLVLWTIWKLGNQLPFVHRWFFLKPKWVESKKSCCHRAHHLFVHHTVWGYRLVVINWLMSYKSAPSFTPVRCSRWLQILYFIRFSGKVIVNYHSPASHDGSKWE